MPNLQRYHESITKELDALKNRIRDLVTHWLTDGEGKESVLRTIMSRHLPSSVFVGRGFIVDRSTSSAQIDILVLRPETPTLFRDGNLAIVTPDVPRAIVSVKTELTGQQEWRKAAVELAQHGAHCKRVAKNTPWLGLFSYEGNEGQVSNMMESLCYARKKTGYAINAACCGYDYFARFWPKGEFEDGDDPVVDKDREYWRAYGLIQARSVVLHQQSDRCRVQC